jgi:hypothetical protein
MGARIRSAEIIIICVICVPSNRLGKREADRRQKTGDCIF